MKKNKSLWYDYDDNTVRGSFINLALTVIFVVITIAAAFDGPTADRVDKISDTMLGVFLISLGVWKAGGVMRDKHKFINKYLNKDKKDKSTG